MGVMMSACGVLCSECPAYHGREKGATHQKKTASAWQKIYGLKVAAEDITCGGCCGPDERLFQSSLKCKARRCCHSKGFTTCAECPVEKCPDLEKAQSVWDEVPELGKRLSQRHFVLYAQAYCGHRERLAEARRAFWQKR